MTTTQTLDTSVAHFESIYAEAAGDASRVPWADEQPHPALVNWLNAVAPSLVRCGGRVMVVGCGLGDDAQALIRRGYDVTAFDCSPTAIRWAKQRDAANAGVYQVANLFELPTRWHHRFDLVVEVNTLQSLLPDQRGEAMQALASLLARHGHLLVICRAAEEPVNIDDGPPWALTLAELKDAAEEAGLTADSDISVFDDDESPSVRRIRGVFRRGS